MRKRSSDGLGFPLAYTWSKAMGDFLDHLSVGGGATGNFPQDAYNMAADYGPLAFDIPHRFVASAIYELPFGAGRKFVTDGAAAAILGGWSVNGILTLSDGRPFTVTAVDTAGTGAGRITRANCVGNPNPEGFEPTPDKWFDTSAFAPTVGRPCGTCGTNPLPGPGPRSENIAALPHHPPCSRRTLGLLTIRFRPIITWKSQCRSPRTCRIDRRQDDRALFIGYIA